MKQIKKLWVIYWQNYINDTLGLFTGWVIIIFTLIAWLSFKDTTGATNSYDPFVVASAIGISCVRISMYNFSRTIFLLRSSDLFERMNTIGTKKYILVISFILFNFIVCTIIAFVIFLISMCYSAQRATLHSVNWPTFFMGYILVVITCQLFGFLSGMLINSYEWVVTFGLFNYFFSMYFLGLGIPYNILFKNNQLYIAGYCSILRSSVMMMNRGWLGSNGNTFVLINDKTQFSFGYNNNTIIQLVISFCIIFALIIFLIIYFQGKKMLFKKKITTISYEEYIKEYIFNLDKINTINELQEFVKNNSIIYQKSKSKIINNKWGDKNE